MTYYLWLLLAAYLIMGVFMAVDFAVFAYRDGRVGGPAESMEDLLNGPRMSRWQLAAVMLLIVAVWWFFLAKMIWHQRTRGQA